MKSLLIQSSLILLCLAPWACNRKYPLAPLTGPAPTSTFTSTFTVLPSKTFTSTPSVVLTATPTVSATPTPTLTATVSSTPGCGTFYNLTGLQPLTPIITVVFSTPVPTPTRTDNWADITVTPTPSSPVTTFPNTPFNGAVIQSLAQWQALFGTATPPAGVNFNSQMLLVTSLLGGCQGSFGITGACETSTEVEVTETGGPGEPCNLVTQNTTAVALPQSNLPVVLTEFIEEP